MNKTGHDAERTESGMRNENEGTFFSSAQDQRIDDCPNCETLMEIEKCKTGCDILSRHEHADLLSDLDIDDLIQRRRKSDSFFGSSFDRRESILAVRTSDEEAQSITKWKMESNRRIEPVDVIPGQTINGTFYVLYKSPARETRFGYMLKMEVENNGRTYPLVCFARDYDSIIRLSKIIPVRGFIIIRGAGNIFYGRVQIVVRMPFGGVWAAS